MEIDVNAIALPPQILQKGITVEVGMRPNLSDIIDTRPELIELKKSGIIQGVTIRASNRGATYITVEYVAKAMKEEGRHGRKRVQGL